MTFLQRFMKICVEEKLSVSLDSHILLGTVWHSFKHTVSAELWHLVSACSNIDRIKLGLFFKI